VSDYSKAASFGTTLQSPDDEFPKHENLQLYPANINVKKNRSVNGDD
jgi:hypothetical protein